MVRRGEAVGVGKVGAGKAQLPGPAVHRLCKGGGGALQVDADGRRRVVGGREHGGVKELGHRQGLPLQQADGSGVLHQLHRFGSDSHRLLRRCLLHRQKAGHDFGETGGLHPAAGVLLKEDLSGIRVYQHGGLGPNHRRLGGPGGFPSKEGEEDQRQQQNAPSFFPAQSFRLLS